MFYKGMTLLRSECTVFQKTMQYLTVRLWQQLAEAVVLRSVWHRVCDAIAGVKHDTGRPARSIQRQNCLDGDIHCWHIERLKHDLHTQAPPLSAVKFVTWSRLTTAFLQSYPFALSVARTDCT